VKCFRGLFAAALALFVAIPGGFAAGRLTELVAEVESLYNDIALYRRDDGYLVLTFGARRLNYIESVVNPKDETELPVYYTQAMTAGLAYAANLDDAVIIGLGGGRTAWYLHKSVPGLAMKAVELDPDVVGIAEQYLSVKEEPGFSIDIRDGRVWLARSKEMFDYILVDAYRGPFVPFHLLTKEFYELVEAHLEPGGVVAQNVEPTTMLFDRAVATIGAVFDHLDFYEGRGNVVILAYNGPQKSDEELARVAAERQQQYGFRYDLPTLLKRKYEAAYDKVEPLTDDFAPVEYLKAVERHNEKRAE
jgi:spermidine synthase